MKKVVRTGPTTLSRNIGEIEECFWEGKATITYRVLFSPYDFLSLLNDTFFNEIDDLEKSRQVWKVFLVFRAENVLFLCCGKARETKENVFNEVVYIFRGFSGFPKAQKQHIWGPENP